MLMLMATLTRRLQVLIEERRFAQLEHIARERGTTVAALVREALDQVYAQQPMSPRAAAEQFLAREPIDVGTWYDAKADIEDSMDRGT
jgi:predicted DNA-binding ribbon-helix-helix protein